MENFSRSKIVTILVPVTAVLIVLSVGIFWTIPEVQEYLSTQEEERATQRQIDLELSPKKILLEEADIAEIRANIDIVDQALPPEPNPAFILSYVETVAGEVGIDLQRIGFSNIEASETAERIVLTFEFTAESNIIQRFLDELSTSIPLVYINTFNADNLANVSNAGDSDNNREYEVIVRLIAPFTSKSSSQLTSGLSPQTTLSNDDVIVEEIRSLSDKIGSLEGFKSQDSNSGKTNPFINN